MFVDSRSKRGDSSFLLSIGVFGCVEEKLCRRLFNGMCTMPVTLLARQSVLSHREGLKMTKALEYTMYNYTDSEGRDWAHLVDASAPANHWIRSQKVMEVKR